MLLIIISFFFNLSLILNVTNLKLGSIFFFPSGNFLGLKNLESINLSFTMITDAGLKKLSSLTSLKSLNLDARQITDVGLAALTSKHSYTIVSLGLCMLLFALRNMV